jgi:hypothetical protein
MNVTGLPVSNPVVTGTSTLKTPPYQTNLSTEQNAAFSDSTAVVGMTRQKIASYIIAAPSDENIGLHSLDIRLGQNINIQWLGNLYITVDGLQFGFNPRSGTDWRLYLYSPVRILGDSLIAANSTAVIDVYADIPGNAPVGWQNTTTLSGCSASGGAGFTPAATFFLCNSSQGQTITFRTQN